MAAAVAALGASDKELLRILNVWRNHIPDFLMISGNLGARVYE